MFGSEQYVGLSDLVTCSLHMPYGPYVMTSSIMSSDQAHSVRTGQASFERHFKQEFWDYHKTHPGFDILVTQFQLIRVQHFETPSRLHSGPSSVPPQLNFLKLFLTSFQSDADRHFHGGMTGLSHMNEVVALDYDGMISFRWTIGQDVLG
jgi:hypothetical protein